MQGTVTEHQRMATTMLGTFHGASHSVLRTIQCIPYTVIALTYCHLSLAQVI